MDPKYRVIVENWNKFINEEEQVEEGIMDMVRQVGRDFTGALEGAQVMRRKVGRLMHMTPSEDGFSSRAEDLLGSLRAQGVEWLRPDTTGAPVVDPDEVEAAIGAYMKDNDQYDNFQSVMINLKNALDDFIKGKKRK